MKFISRVFSKAAIRVDGGRARMVKGKLNHRLVSEISVLCAEVGITDCEIWLDAAGRVSFSSEVDAKHYQQFRNIVAINR